MKIIRIYHVFLVWMGKPRPCLYLNVPKGWVCYICQEQMNDTDRLHIPLKHKPLCQTIEYLQLHLIVVRNATR